MPDLWTLAGLLFILTHVAGVLSTMHVLMTGRTPQGVLAWIFFLILLPYVAVPLYWVFGPRRYDGYVDARMTGAAPFDGIIADLRERVAPVIVDAVEQDATIAALERLVRLPLTRGNDLELLKNGEATFAAIFEAMERARSFVLVQYFIVRSDDIGHEMQHHLVQCAQRGVRVYFLYDEIGSRGLSAEFLKTLREAGVKVDGFSPTRLAHRFQINFRNHRKMVIVDGELGFTGGLNCGDEYLGRDPKMSPWRDTFLRIRGPVVQGMQLSFLEDWHWAQGEVPDLAWPLEPASTGVDYNALVLPTGPADRFESCSLLFVALFHAAKERLWISTPYFVFDNQILSALQLAALRGVDVRILVPERADYETVYFAGWSFHEDVLKSGCRIFRYSEGFMHQKAVLVDDHRSLLGTMNLDNRSMRLNFELGVLVEDRAFAAQVEAMLDEDFSKSEEVTEAKLDQKSRWFRLKSRVARVFSPVL